MATAREIFLCECVSLIRFKFITLLLKPPPLSTALANAWWISDDERQYDTEMLLTEWQYLSCDCCKETANVCFELIDRVNVINSICLCDEFNNDDSSLDRFVCNGLIRHPYSLRYTAFKWFRTRSSVQFMFAFPLLITTQYWLWLSFKLGCTHVARYKNIQFQTF